MEKNGTSEMAMMSLSNWLRGLGKSGQLPTSGNYLSGEQVYLGFESRLNDALRSILFV